MVLFSYLPGFCSLRLGKATAIPLLKYKHQKMRAPQREGQMEYQPSICGMACGCG